MIGALRVKTNGHKLLSSLSPLMKTVSPKQNLFPKSRPIGLVVQGTKHRRSKGVCVFLLLHMVNSNDHVGMVN